MISLTSHIYRLDGPSLPIELDTKRFEMVPLDRSRIEKLFESEETRSAMLTLHDKNLNGIALVEEGRWAAYGWISRPGGPGPSHLPRTIRQAGLPWIQYCHTREEYRGLGCYKKILVELIDKTRTEYPDASIGIDTGRKNLPAQRAIRRIGFQPAGTAWSLRIPKSGDKWLFAFWFRNADHDPEAT